MRHPILPCRLTRVFISPLGISPVRGPALITTFWFWGIRGVFENPRLSRLIHWAPKIVPPPARSPKHFQENLPTSSLTAHRADRLAQGFSRHSPCTTRLRLRHPPSSTTTSKFKLCLCLPPPPPTWPAPPIRRTTSLALSRSTSPCSWSEDLKTALALRPGTYRPFRV